MLVIDTKWKRFGLNLEDAKHGVALADVFQMMAYGRLYGCGNPCCFIRITRGWGRGLSPRPMPSSAAHDSALVLLVELMLFRLDPRFQE